MNKILSKILKLGKENYVECIICGSNKELGLIAHENKKGFIVGFIFACDNCSRKLFKKEVKLSDAEINYFEENKF